MRLPWRVLCARTSQPASHRRLLANLSSSLPSALPPLACRAARVTGGGPWDRRWSAPATRCSRWARWAAPMPSHRPLATTTLSSKSAGRLAAAVAAVAAITNSSTAGSSTLRQQQAAALLRQQLRLQQRLWLPGRPSRHPRQCLAMAADGSCLPKSTRVAVACRAGPAVARRTLRWWQTPRGRHRLLTLCWLQRCDCSTQL